MRANSQKLSKFWIPSILILFLSPFLLNVIRDEISSLIDSQRNFNRVEVAQAQRGIPDNEVIRADRYSLEEPNSLTQEELVSIVNQAVEAEVSKSFGVTFNLINFLLATLAIIPVVSGLAIWLWNQYFDEKITSKAKELVEVEIQKK